jgi:hypothetical protein
MKFESIIIKVTNTMRLRGFTTQTQKTYMNCITNYLKFLKQKSTKPCSESAKEYLLKLNLLGKDSNTIKVHSASIRFLLLLYFKVSSFLIISKKVKRYSLYIGRSNTFIFIHY